MELEHVLVIRHGQSVHNLRNGVVLRGGNSPWVQQLFDEMRGIRGIPMGDAEWQLTERGRLQARLASDIIQLYLRDRGLEPDTYICSPYKRAAETANILFPRVTWQEDLRFRERDWGNTCHGIRKLQSYRRAHARMVKKCDTDIHYTPGYLGETVYSRLHEVGEAVRDLSLVHHARCAVVVGHGECAKIIRLAKAGGDPSAWAPICETTRMGNLMFLHFTLSAGNWRVRMCNPLTPDLSPTPWQPLDPREVLVSA